MLRQSYRLIERSSSCYLRLMSTRAALPPRKLGREHHEKFVKTIKGLAMDAVQAANSGHPGMPMGTADFASTLR